MARKNQLKNLIVVPLIHIVYAKLRKRELVLIIHKELFAKWEQLIPTHEGQFAVLYLQNQSLEEIVMLKIAIFVLNLEPQARNNYRLDICHAIVSQ